MKFMSMFDLDVELKFWGQSYNRKEIRHTLTVLTVYQPSFLIELIFKIKEWPLQPRNFFRRKPKRTISAQRISRFISFPWWKLFDCGNSVQLKRKSGCKVSKPNCGFSLQQQTSLADRQALPISCWGSRPTRQPYSRPTIHISYAAGSLFAITVYIS